MARYEYTYACGHGEAEVLLFGKIDERHRNLEWLSQNKVCPDCYKARMRAADDAAEQVATICFIGPVDLRFVCQVEGKLAANMEALKTLGYSWQDDTTGGVLSLLSTSKPKKMLAKHSQKLGTDAEMRSWVKTVTEEVSALGYTVRSGLTALDGAVIKRLIAENAERAAHAADEAARIAAIRAVDPEPRPSPLRKRIADIEASSNAQWNLTIYGAEGRWHFYVNNVKHDATDTEVAEWRAQIKAHAAWKNRHQIQ
jgi:hypothetical protein